MFANILLLLVPLLSLVFASPLAKRDNPTMFGGSATVEWSNNGNHQIRNYHVDAATQQIYESSQSSTYGNIWTTNPMGIYCRPQGGLQALVVKRSAAENDVEIRLFYEDLADTGYPQGNMKSSIYLPHTGWYVSLMTAILEMLTVGIGEKTPIFTVSATLVVPLQLSLG